MRVFVTGAHGHLGAAVVQRFGRHADVAAFSHRDLDVTARHDVRSLIERHRPDVIINCAAFNDVDGAEDHPATALEVNAVAVSVLARAAADIGATFVHYSSDFVFDGEGTRPYVEEDVPRPRSAYAFSKLLGERFAVDATRHYILRVESLFGGPTAGDLSRPGTFATLVDLMRSGQPVPVFSDRVVSPAYAPDVAFATHNLLAAKAPFGLYHCVNDGAATWEALVTAAGTALGLTPSFKRMKLSDATLRAPRPRYSVLSPGRLARHGIAMRTWQEAVRAWLAPENAGMRAG